jgi:hypothetical protein
VADQALGRPSEELLLEARTSQNEVERHPRGPVHQGHDACGLDESCRVGDAQFEAFARERVDELTARARAQVDGDVDVGTEAGGTVKDRGLRPEREPADAERAEPAREVGEKVSDQLRRGRHPRRDRSRASARCGVPGLPGVPSPSASRD